MFRQNLHLISKERKFNRGKLRGHPELSEKGGKSGVRIIGMCSWCKKFRGHDGDWYPLNQLKVENANPRISHGICPACAEIWYPDIYEAIRLKRARS